MWESRRVSKWCSDAGACSPWFCVHDGMNEWNGYIISGARSVRKEVARNNTSVALSHSHRAVQKITTNKNRNLFLDWNYFIKVKNFSDILVFFMSCFLGCDLRQMGLENWLFRWCVLNIWYVQNFCGRCFWSFSIWNCSKFYYGYKNDCEELVKMYNCYSVDLLFPVQEQLKNLVLSQDKMLYPLR